MKRGLLGLVIVSVVLCSAFLAARGRTVSAQNSSFNVIISPLPTRLSADPGEAVSTEMRLKNNGSSPERIKVGLMKFGASGDLGRPDLKDREPGDDYFDWVTFTPSVFDAPPGQWITVKMTINVPKSAGLGYYYAVTFSRVTNAKEKGKTSVIGSTASLVLLDVASPNARRQASLTGFSTDRKVYEFLPVSLDVKIHNEGNIHIVPVGNIFISRGKQPVATIDVNKPQGNVLPNSNRVFTLKWSDGFPVYEDKLLNEKPVVDKHGKQVRTLKWNFAQVSKLRIGKYTAKLVMVYNDGKRDVPLEAVVQFWVIPWRMLAVGVGVPLLLITLVILMYVNLRRTKRKLRQLSHDKKS